MRIDSAENVTSKRKVGQMMRTATMDAVTRHLRTALLALVAAIAAVAMAPATAAAAPISFDTFNGAFEDPAALGQPVRQAGSHPDVRVRFLIPPDDPNVPVSFPVDQAHRLITDMPPGLIGNARAAETCPEAAMKGGPDGNSASCPVGSQVGVAHIIGPGPFNVTAAPVFNIERPDDAPAMFAFHVLSVVVKLTPSVRPGDFGVTIDTGTISQGLISMGGDVTLWGVPADPAHDFQRVPEGVSLFYLPGFGYFNGGAKVSSTPRPLLSLGTECSGEPLVTRGVLDGWNDIGTFASSSFDTDENGEPFVLTGCDKLPFEPEIDVANTSAVADQPTGLAVDLRVPQSDSVSALATAHVKDVRMVLPEGMSVSPSSAAGLGACSPEQIGVGNDLAPSCPRSSKLGTVTVDTPVLDESLTGDVILATPDDNPFGSLISLYIVAEGAGVRIKLPGRVDPDPVTGQLTATFSNNPQLPFDRLRVRLDGGDKASLATPTACGRYETRTQITSWSGKSVDLVSPMAIDEGCGPRGFAPSFAAGSESPVAGASSAVSLAIAREDRSQELSTIDSVKLPKGLLGKVASVPLCADVDADAGTCGDGSRIGHVQVAAGPGGTPVWVPQPGKAPTSVSLAGPYKGAPYSLSVVVPAQAGPFDLGRVVVRSPLHLDRRTAQLSTGIDVSRVYDRKGALAETISGAMPTSVEGIPLRIRDLRVIVDRKDFAINPTSCAPSSVDATLRSTAGQTAAVSSRFRVGDCAALAFTPRLGMRLTGKGRTRTGSHPGLTATLRQGNGQANIAKVRVALPSSVVLDPNNSTDPALVCDYDKGLASDCPASSIIGKATASTPLLNKPLTGNVHLVQGIRFGPTGNRIRTTPSLLVKLRGDVEIDLRGRTTVTNNRLVSNFDQVPDAPVSRFDININGGRKGILVVTRTRKATINLCTAGRQEANARIEGQNGKRVGFATAVKTPCKTKVAKKAKKK